MARAWAVGVAVLALAFGTWILLVRLEVFSYAAVIGLWLSPMAAGFTASYLAPFRKMLVGTSMAVPAALLAVLLNLLPQLSGEAVDLSGSEGSFVLFALTLIGSAALAAAGAGAACLLKADGRASG